MTIEQKAKAYDKVSKEVKDFFEGRQKMYSDVEQTLEYLFPELKESKDERIRKAIVATIHLYYGEPLEDEAKEMIAWLEKQKTSEEALQYLRENHSSSEMSDFQAAMNIAVAKAYDKGYNDGLEKQGETYTKKDIDDAYIEGMAFAKNELEKQNKQILANSAKTCKDEQKPTDEEIKTLLRTEYEKGRADAIAEMQVAWSEEDESYLNTTIAYLKDAKEFKKTAENCIDWLKSLKDRVRPKQEWSEEDIRNIEDIDSILFYNKDLPEDTCMRLRNWLKSLRPQSQWNPSDEQLEALKNAIHLKPFENPSDSILWGLYEQLKKL